MGGTVGLWVGRAWAGPTCGAREPVHVLGPAGGWMGLVVRRRKHKTSTHRCKVSAPAALRRASVQTGSSHPAQGSCALFRATRQACGTAPSTQSRAWRGPRVESNGAGKVLVSRDGGCSQGEVLGPSLGVHDGGDGRGSGRAGLPRAPTSCAWAALSAGSSETRTPAPVLITTGLPASAGQGLQPTGTLLPRPFACSPCRRSPPLIFPLGSPRVLPPSFRPTQQVTLPQASWRPAPHRTPN